MQQLNIERDEDSGALSWLNEAFFLSATGITFDDVAPVYILLLAEVDT